MLQYNIVSPGHGVAMHVAGCAGRAVGTQAARACGRGARGRQADSEHRRARRALGARACWASERRRGRRAGRRWRRRGRAGARRWRACAHGGHAGWVSWAILGFGEPGSVLTRFVTRF